jgi:hypothetical protein
VKAAAFGAVVGLLVGLAWCYYKQLQAAYENRNLISSGGNLVGAAQDFWAQVKKL